MAQAIRSECTDFTPIWRHCRCKPKCVVCGYGPHAGVHMGCADDPGRAYDHAYCPNDPAGDIYFNTPTKETP